MFIFLFVAPQALFAQAPARGNKTDFNNFIEKSSVEWAVYANDTASFRGSGFTEKLLELYELGKIRGIVPLENGAAGEDHLMYRNSTELAQLLTPAPDTFYNGESIEIKNRTKKLSELLANPVFELYRIFYIQNGLLRSYITRISPKTPVVTSSGIALGLLEPVSFAANKNYQPKTRTAEKMMYLGKISRIISPDSIPEYDRLKETYGRNMIETLWSNVMSGNISVYVGAGKEKIAPDQLISGKYPGGEMIDVPVYDNMGNQSGTRTMYNELSPASFNKVNIIEELYYDRSRNIITSKIAEVLLYRKEYDSNSPTMQPIRLVF